MQTANERRKNFIENRDLCEENPGVFMICPRCNGTKSSIPIFSCNWEKCNYCNGHGVITWIDKVIRGKKNPFTEGEK